MELGLSGLASGFDWKSVVDQLVEVDKASEFGDTMAGLYDYFDRRLQESTWRKRSSRSTIFTIA
ncbi:MAG: hypothetical protein COC21_04645 [Verrucomicrobiales bacterium]|jgi:hypothetical protein|nr:MAG: hypothetical protein COC21_04645 [Verrucomicrobiales bacterium]